MKKFGICMIFLFAVCSVMYACETGFACSIDKLKGEQVVNDDTVKENKQEVPEINEALFFSGMTKNINYSDLFIYKNSIYQLNNKDK